MKYSILFLLLISIPGFAQDLAQNNPDPKNELAVNELPNSKFNISLGYGATFSGIGTKVVIGGRNSGLMFSVGHPNGNPVIFNFGCQIAVKELFIDVCYGYVGTNVYEDGSKDVFLGGSITMGGMLNLNQNKRAFLEISVGSSFGVEKDWGYFTEKNNFLIINVGLGYRFGTKKLPLDDD